MLAGVGRRPAPFLACYSSKLERSSASPEKKFREPKTRIGLPKEKRPLPTSSTTSDLTTSQNATALPPATGFRAVRRAVLESLVLFFLTLTVLPFFDDISSGRCCSLSFVTLRLRKWTGALPAHTNRDTHQSLSPSAALTRELPVLSNRSLSSHRPTAATESTATLPRQTPLPDYGAHGKTRPRAAGKHSTSTSHAAQRGLSVVAGAVDSVATASHSPRRQDER